MWKYFPAILVFITALALTLAVHATYPKTDDFLLFEAIFDIAYALTSLFLLSVLHHLRNLQQIYFLLLIGLFVSLLGQWLDLLDEFYRISGMARDSEDLLEYSGFALLVVAIIKWIQHNNTLNRQLLQLAITDELTQLLNRRAFIEQAEQILIRSCRYQHTQALLLLDIDHFKRLNDNYGHAVGDEVLIHFSHTIKTILRSHDLFARWGGEEFVVLLQIKEQADGEAAAEKLRAHIEKQTIPSSARDPISITVSIGLLLIPPGSRDLAPLLNQADEALYQAKKQGRNCICLGNMPKP